jgi:hypothetical protein
MRKEPAVIGAALAAVVNVIVLLVFKRELEAEEKAAVVTVVTLLWGVWTRSKVRPVA